MPNVNVGFKRGSQFGEHGLNALIASVSANTENGALKNANGDKYIEGTFYLTNDTDRLYFAQSETELVELNQSIKIVDSINDLPTSTNETETAILGSEVEVGQFYYITGGAGTGDYANTHYGNILAVCSAINPESHVITWTQVNPDTDNDHNTDHEIQSISITKNTSQSTNSSLVYDVTLSGKYHSLGNSDTNINIPTTFTISANDITNLAGAAVSVGSSAVITENSNTYVTVNTAGTGHAGNGFKIKQGNNVQLTGSSANEFTISATDTQYELKSPAVSGATEATSTKLNLGIKNGNNTGGGSITVKTGNSLAINNASADEFTIYHKNSGVTANSYGTSASNTPSAGGKIKVPKIAVDAQGHITTASDQEITLPADTNTYVSAVTADNTGKITITNAGSASNKVTSGNNAVLYNYIKKYDANGNLTDNGTDSNGTKVLNQGTLGEFYTKQAIDTKFLGLNAMTFRGNTTAIPSSNVHNGDAWLVTQDFTSGNISYKKGDLIIACGDEGTDGTIAATDLTWTRIPVGTDLNTTYSFRVAGNNIYYQPSGNSESTLVTIDGGNKLTASTSGTTITLNHDTSGVTADNYGPSANKNLSASDTFTVPYVTVDTYGHITGAVDRTYKLPADNNTTYSFSVADETITATPSSGTAAKIVQIVGNNKISASTTAASGSTPAKITLQHTTSGVTADNYGPAADKTLSAGNNFTVPYITVDTYGHITGAVNKTYTLPPDNNTQYGLCAKSSVNPSASNANPTYSPGVCLYVKGGGAYYNLGFSSSTLNLGVSGNYSDGNTISMDLVWGTF